MTRLTITRPDDWHLHLRDGDYMRAVLPDAARRFARAIVMPNLTAPVTTTDLALKYHHASCPRNRAHLSFEPLMTLYLTDNTSAREIQRAKASGLVRAVKYYPAGATTNSESGVSELVKCEEALGALEESGLPLLRARRSHLSQRRHLRSRAAVYRPRVAAGAAKISEAAPGVRAHHDQGSRAFRARRTAARGGVLSPRLQQVIRLELSAVFRDPGRRTGRGAREAVVTRSRR